MPVNYDGVYEVRMFYTTVVSSVAIEHKHTFDVRLVDDYNPGVPFGDIDVLNHDNTVSSLITMVMDYAGVLVDVFENTADFNSVELWKYGAEPSTDAVFIAGDTIGAPGTSASATVAAQQATLTYRSAGGGIMRTQLMEVITTLNTQLVYPSSSTPYNDIMDYVMLLSNAFVARDNERPIFGLKQSFGQNEKLWRKRFRNL